MSRTYTPGLKVLHRTTVEKIRQLPLKGKVHMKTGENVKPENVVASTHIPGNVQMLNIARLLNVEAENVSEMMLASIDEEIQKNQIIAETKGIFGLFKSQVKSPIDGTLANVSDVTGQAIVSEPPIPIEVDAYTSGEVVEVIPEEGLVVKTDAAFIQGILGIGGENRGHLKLAVNSPNDELTPDKIDESLAGSIVVGGSYITLETFKKAQEIGISAIVVGGFNYNDLSKILGYSLGVAITGSEELITTLIITEGFGKISMADRTFDLLKTHEGDFAAINGATQIRAGVIRPEIIIPFKEKSAELELIKEIDISVSEGSLVRVIRAPYFGIVGKVKSLPPPLTQMESETMARVAEIEFEDGSVHTIPRANLELIMTD